MSQSYPRSKSNGWHFQRVNQILAGLNHSLELSINLTSWLSLMTVVPLNCIQTSFLWAWLVTQVNQNLIYKILCFSFLSLTQSLLACLWIPWLCMSHHKFLVLQFCLWGFPAIPLSPHRAMKELVLLAVFSQIILLRYFHLNRLLLQLMNHSCPIWQIHGRACQFFVGLLYIVVIPKAAFLYWDPQNMQKPNLSLNFYEIMYYEFLWNYKFKMLLVWNWCHCLHS